MASDFLSFKDAPHRLLGFPVGDGFIQLGKKLFLIPGQHTPEALLNGHVVESVVFQIRHVQQLQQPPLFPEILLLVRRHIPAGFNIPVEGGPLVVEDAEIDGSKYFAEFKKVDTPNTTTIDELSAQSGVEATFVTTNLTSDFIKSTFL